MAEQEDYDSHTDAHAALILCINDIHKRLAALEQQVLGYSKKQSEVKTKWKQ